MRQFQSACTGEKPTELSRINDRSVNRLDNYNFEKNAVGVELTYCLNSMVLFLMPVLVEVVFWCWQKFFYRDSLK